MNTELDRQGSLRQEAETRLKEAEQMLKTTQAKSKQLINALQNQVEEQGGTRVSHSKWCQKIAPPPYSQQG